MQACTERTSGDRLDLAQDSKSFANGEDDGLSKSLLLQSSAFLAIPLLEDHEAK